MSTPVETVAEIKSAAMEGASVRDIARHHQISVSTVSRIIRGGYCPAVAPSVEGPLVHTARVGQGVIREDASVLRGRGCSTAEIARTLGVSARTVQRYAK